MYIKENLHNNHSSVNILVLTLDRGRTRLLRKLLESLLTVHFPAILEGVGGGRVSGATSKICSLREALFQQVEFNILSGVVSPLR